MKVRFIYCWKLKRWLPIQGEVTLWKPVIPKQGAEVKAVHEPTGMKATGHYPSLAFFTMKTVASLEEEVAKNLCDSLVMKYLGIKY